MKTIRKRIWIVSAAVVGLCVLVILGAVWMTSNGYGITCGRILSANGKILLLDGDTPIVVSDRTRRGRLFADSLDGDQMLVLHDGINESYPAQTGAYAAVRLSRGGLDDIPETALTQLAALGWTVQPELILPKDMPEDFSFSLRWGCFGISSYDSKTGTLIKTTDASHPEDYVTVYQMSAEERSDIYEILRVLDINDYPSAYNPNPDLASSPSMTLVLTVRIGDVSRAICAEHIALAYEADNKKGQRFLSACREIQDRLTATDAWLALPEYEFFYD